MLAKKTTTVLGAAGALLVAAALHQFTLEAAPARNSDPRRAYYLTTTVHTGSQALTACAAGYHMASVFELVSPSVLRYETTLGVVHADSGSGPPDGVAGWAQSGRQVACDAWTSDDAFEEGYRAFFTTLGSTTSEFPPHLTAATRSCASQAGVWCIQD